MHRLARKRAVLLAPTVLPLGFEFGQHSPRFGDARLPPFDLAFEVERLCRVVLRLRYQLIAVSLFSCDGRSHEPYMIVHR